LDSGVNQLRTSLVITFIGEDRPGLIEYISAVVAEHDGNWLESRMSQLAGKFAGIVRVGLASEQVSEMSHALKALEAKGLSVLVETSDVGSDSSGQKLLELNMLGLDRPGIVREVSQALAKYSINVLKMNTDISNAPMTGELMFNADAQIEIPDSVDLKDLHEQLDLITDELAVEIELINTD
jgi:glycine cleavage system regulatory protein